MPPSKFRLVVPKVALLKEAAAKKDAEISNLQTFKERYERGESAVGVEKFKPRPSKPTARVRMSTDTIAGQKIRIVQPELGSAAVEVCFFLDEEVCLSVEELGNWINICLVPKRTS